MKLLVITNLFFPDRGGGASVFSDLCYGLAEKGWEVSVFTTYPYYPEWRRKTEGSALPIRRETIRGVDVWRHGLYVPTHPSQLLPRILYELSFGLSLLRSLYRGAKFDAVMVYCPMLGAVMFAGLRKLLRGEPLWLNVQDIPAEAAVASGISQSGVFNRLAPKLQNFLFNRADVWSTISPVMVDRLATAREHGQPLHLCPNWVHSSLADCLENVVSKSGRVPGASLKLLYAGNIGKKQGLLEFCVELARSDIPFSFSIHGNGGEAATVQRWIQESADPRFRSGGFLEESAFVGALHDCDLFVITEKSGSGASFIPSKLIPAIAVGTPILAVCDRLGPLGREVLEMGLGIVIEWNEVGGLAGILRDLMADPARFTQLQNNCLRHARNYNRTTGIDRMAGLIQEMSRRPEAAPAVN